MTTKTEYQFRLDTIKAINGLATTCLLICDALPKDEKANAIRDQIGSLIKVSTSMLERLDKELSDER